MFFKLPFLTIIFTGVVIFENKIPLSFAKDVSTESTKVDQVKVASTLKIINQVNEAGRVQEQINKKRRKSGGRTLGFNPNERKTSGRSITASRVVFDSSKIISGVCHTKRDRMGIALGFLPEKTEKESLQYLDNLIECGLPCFKENGQQQKNMPDSFAPGCCDCCEAKNDLYQEQFFSTTECGDCVYNFIHKSYDVPEVESCVAEKNKQTNISMDKPQTVYECWECVEDDADDSDASTKPTKVKKAPNGSGYRQLLMGHNFLNGDEIKMISATTLPTGSCQDKCIADLTAKGIPDCIKKDACQRACNDGTCPEYNS